MKTNNPYIFYLARTLIPFVYIFILFDLVLAQQDTVLNNLCIIHQQIESYLQENKNLEADSLALLYISSCPNQYSIEICNGRGLSLHARTQYALKNFKYSDELFRQSIFYLRKNIDSCTSDFGNTVIRYFFLLNRDNKKDSARLLLEESKTYFIHQKDTLSKAYAGVIGMLGHVHSLLNNDSTALEYFKIWETIISRNPEAEDAAIANRAGNFYLKKLNHRQAEKLYKLAVQISEKSGRKLSSDFAIFNFNLAAVYLDLKEYSAAESYLKEAKNLFNNLNDTSSLNYFRLLNHLGIYYHGVGSFAKAKEYYKKAIEGFKNNSNPDWHHLASIYFDLAIIYEQTDQLKDALAYYNQSLDIRINTLKILKEDYARTTAAIANIYQALGQKDRALRSLQFALPILKQNLGEDNFIYAEFLKNLASINLEYGNYVIADSLAQSSNQIYKRTQGDKSIDYASSLELLALVHFDRSDFSKALEYYNQTLDIYQNKFKPNHLKISLLQLKRIGCLRALNKYRDGLKILEECKVNIKSILGEQNVYYIDVLVEEVRFYQALNMQSEHKTSLLNLTSLLIHQILQNSVYLSASEIISYIKQFRHNIDLVFNHTTQYFSKDEELIKVCLNASTFYKSFVLNKLLIERRKVYSSDQATDLVRKIRNLKEEYQIVALQPDSNPDRLRRLLDYIRDEEKELNKIADTRHESYSEFDPKAQLKPKETLVDFIQYNASGIPDSIQYAAIVYNQLNSQYSILRLFKESELRKFFQQNIALRSEYVERLYQPIQRGVGIEGESITSLYELIWKPIVAVISGCERIHYAPVGLLHRLNLNALYIQDEEIISDRYYMNQLYHAASIKDTTSIPLKINSALLAGGISFNSPSDSSNTYITTAPYWKDLKWTLKEVQEIDEICHQAGMSHQLLIKEEVSEVKIRNYFQNNAYDIVHIATHGFFFPQVDSGHDASPIYQTSIQQLEDPMLRSGILLAGANNTWNTSASRSSEEDGILTAYELSNLNLDQTTLTILSACETGLGDIDDAEGVYGLQRALKIAGVKYMLISLWQVPDKETSAFMVTFYRNLIYLHMDIEKAYHKTQQEMRDRFVNPYQWAGFVLIK